MKQIRTAIFGTGFIGRVHLDAVRRLEAVEAVAIADVNIDMARRLAEGFAISNVSADYREILHLSLIHIYTVSNGVAFTGLQVTNAPGNAFFRLH